MMWEKENKNIKKVAEQIIESALFSSVFLLVALYILERLSPGFVLIHIRIGVVAIISMLLLFINILIKKN